MKNQERAYLYAALAILCWSTVAVAFKIALSQLSIIQTLSISCYTAITGLSSYIFFTGKWKEFYKIDRRFILQSAFLGLLNPFLYYLVLFKAYSVLPAQIAQPLNYTWPLILVLLSIIFLKQKISKAAILGIFISFLGVLIISMQGGSSITDIENPMGVAFSIGSSLIWATYWLLNASRLKYQESGLLLNFIFAGIYITLLMLITNGFHHFQIKGVLASIYIGFFEMGFTFLIWLKALQLSKDSGKVSHLVYFAPFISLFFIHIFLKEPIYGTTFIGLIFIIGGVIVSKLKKRNNTINTSL